MPFLATLDSSVARNHSAPSLAANKGATCQAEPEFGPPCRLYKDCGDEIIHGRFVATSLQDDSRKISDI
jgi:hypothetical protein